MNSDARKSRKVRQVIVYTAATIVFFALTVGLLYGLRPMLLPFVLGAFLAYLLKPIAKSFRGSTVTKYARAGVLLCFVGVVVYGSIALIRSSLPNESEKLQLKVRLQYRLNERYQSWMGLADGKAGNLIYKTLGKEFDELKQKAVEYVRLNDEERQQFLYFHEEGGDENRIGEKYYNYYLANLKAQKIDILKLREQKKLNPDAQVTAVKEPETNTLAAIMKAFTHWIIMPLAFIFILMDRGQITHFFLGIIPNRYFELAHSVLENVDEALGKYIRGTMIECFLVGLSLAVGFFLCGMDLKAAALIGAIGGITNAIPFVGTLIACVVGAAYALIAENVSPILPFINENNLMIAIVAVVMVAHLLDNAIYQPLVVGSAVNIHPLVVIVGVFGGSIMFGFAGLIFAIPTIVVFKVVTQTFFSGLKDYRII